MAQKRTKSSSTPLEKAGKAKRPTPLSVRLTVEERAELERRAGGAALSSYVKAVVLGDGAPVVRVRRGPDVDRRLLAQVLARLGASGVAHNLAVLARAAEAGALVVDEAVVAELRAACAEVVWVRGMLMRALGLKEPGANERPDDPAEDRA